MDGSSRWNIFRKKRYAFPVFSVFLAFTIVLFHLAENSHRFSCQMHSAPALTAILTLDEQEEKSTFDKEKLFQ